MSFEPTHLIDALKAAGEPTRLRLLSLLREGDLAVGEMVQILDQSQPRLSHHLKTLTTAQLVERMPEGAWVFYRATRKGWAKRLLDAFFEDLETDGADFAQDRVALAKVRANRARSAETYFSSIASDWDEIRSLHFPNEAIETELLKAVGRGPFDTVIDIGTGTGRMLRLFAGYSREAEGLDISHQMLTIARANLAEAGIENARVRQGDAAETPFATGVADLVIIHQVLHFMDDPLAVIKEAGRLLKPGGRVVIVDFAPHDLEFLREAHGHRRLGVRREDMAEWAGVSDLSLKPPLRFDPPTTLEQGLAVHIWLAERKSNRISDKKDAAA